MKKQNEKLRDAIFLITGEQSCPFYSVGEELKVDNASLSISSYKPVCLFLAENIIKVVTSRQSFSGLPKIAGRRAGFGGQKTRHDCGGCTGMIYFEFKQEKDYATLQMKMLKDAEEQRRRKHLERFFGLLRGLVIFDSLDDESLADLTVLLELKTVPPDKVLQKEGEPGVHLFLIVKGRVVVIEKDGGKGAEMGPGEIFGEMNLLSGDPVTNSIHTVDVTQVAMLSVKNFKIVLKKYPELQIFLFKLLVDRAQAIALKAGNITSGMTGQLEDVSIVDLFQLINSSQKTGTIELSLKEGKALVFFNEGEIVYARFLQLLDKEAVFALMTIKKGYFSYIRKIPDELKKRPPLGGFMGLMMEGLQRIDEGG